MKEKEYHLNKSISCIIYSMSPNVEKIILAYLDHSFPVKLQNGFSKY